MFQLIWRWGSVNRQKPASIGEIPLTLTMCTGIKEPSGRRLSARAGAGMSEVGSDAEGWP